MKPIDWYLTELGWPERNAAYLEGAQALFIDAASRALANAGCEARDVDTIVTVSSTGIATPSLEARAAGVMGFRSDVERVPVFGLGCAGGVSGLAIAGRLARARPGSTVLMVAIEICTAAFRMDQLSAANMVATALFGDGAAACVVRSGESGLARIEGAGEHLWPDSLDIMGWKVDPSGLGVIFDRSIPPFAEEHVGSAVDGILARIGVARNAVDRFACHPGGAKVITALETHASARPGHARPRARRARGVRQHVRADRAVRARAAGRAGPAAPHRADRSGAGLHLQLPVAGKGCMTLAGLILGLVTLQRLGELVLARRNTERLLAQGAYEVAAGHYPLIVVLHAAWLAGLWFLVVYDRSDTVSWPWLGAFVILQALRVWVIATLGPRWTTRIIVLPGAPLVASGPYRFVSHPNYCVVAAEILVLPLVFGLVWYGIVFSALNAAVLWIRIRAEAAALRRG